ncbi:hypothetical protein RND81_10G175800 [Saponaria officinalis]|uniref:F-box domain-containing protein n=1 Tax=Saponaria officinalis TaxID=3572 RepID=A0AAW1I5R3_SAPOF
MFTQKTPLPYLSEELLLDILCRLPIKSLVRFRCVCTSWRSLLSNDLGFATRYKSRNPDTYGYFDPNTHNFVLIKYSDLKIKDIIIDNNNLHANVTVIGSIDGVVCYVRGNTQFVLWNPSTRDSYLVPCPNISEDLVNRSYFGFGFGGSFSIVRIIRINCDHHWMNGDPYCCTPQIEAECYNSITDNWTNIGKAPKKFLMCTDECGVVVGRTSYWCTYTWRASIISFSHDLRKFSELNGPGSGAENASLGWNLGEISGSLVAIVQNVDGGVGVWKMVDDDGGGSRLVWVKQVQVGPSDGLGKVVNCWRNGEFLVANIVGHSNGFVTKLSLYNPWTKNIRLFSDFLSKKGRIPEVFLYVESLISPRGYTHSTL